MSSKDIRISFEHQSLTSLKNNIDNLGPKDRYEEYLTFGNKSESSNSRNLFDDSKLKDRNWFKVTKEFLEKRS
jgi:hypothetical protein